MNKKIDIKKYEGHALSLESVLSGYFTIEQIKEVDKALMEDAPLLLEEVKRLREAMKTMLDDMNNASPEEDIEYWLDTWKHWLKEMVE